MSQKITVRWESAMPVLAAMGSPLPANFDDHYVIGVSGLPFGGRGRRQDDDQDPLPDNLDHMRQFTTLEPKTKRAVQPGIVEPQTSGYGGSILFGFSKEILDLSLDDKEVVFTTQSGPMKIQAKFTFSEMKYQGRLAL